MVALSLVQSISLLGALTTPPPLSRRDAVGSAAVAVAAIPLLSVPFAARAADKTTVRAAWTATDGFSDKSFISFDEGAYAAMRDDVRRTPLFEEAIKRRLAKAPRGTLTVLDVGTGPYALLALAAARAGAKKVYTIEANAEAASRARAAIKKASDVPTGTIQVIEGFSTSIDLPEKVDVLVAEIAGSIASEEGAIATIRDAQSRLVKQPGDPSSYIPYACQTIGAPASYALHYALGPPQVSDAVCIIQSPVAATHAHVLAPTFFERRMRPRHSLSISLAHPRRVQFDWAKLKEPVRLNCRDQTAQLLADPQLIEDFKFSDLSLPVSGVAALRSAAPSGGGVPPLSWTVDPARVVINEKTFYDELKKEGAKEVSTLAGTDAAFSSPRPIASSRRLVPSPPPIASYPHLHPRLRLPQAEARELSKAVSKSFSGIAMWPRLILDEEATLIVESRGPKGEHQKSHWQTVLPLMAARPPAVEPGSVVRVAYSVDLRDGKVASPLKYLLEGEIA